MGAYPLVEWVMVMKNHEGKLKEVCLEITNTCPMKCLHCSGECGPDLRKMLSLQEIKGVINELHRMGGELLEISGGEPLIHPDLPQIVEYARQHNIETVLYTSGTMLDEIVTKELHRLKLMKVIFNLQGAISSTHEAITQVRGSFEKVLTAIKDAKKLGFWVGVHFVPMKPNYREFRALLRLCGSLEVNEIGVLRFVPQGRGLLNRRLLELSKDEFKEFARDLGGQASADPHVRVGRPIDFRHLFDLPMVESVCNAGISRCLINPDGTVVPCPAFKQNKRYVAGNIKDNSLTTIWTESPMWQELRHFDYMQISEPCKSCEYLHRCRGRCIAQRVLEFEDIYAAPDPNCFAPCLRLELLSTVRW
jgi:radical SAM protein with 4Fe4S-binding SPASM domain